MKKFVFYGVIIIMALYSPACTRTVECPPFDEADLVLVPYSVDDTLRFVNQNSEVFKIVVEDIYPSEAYTFKCRDLNNICVCENTVHILASDTETSVEYWFLKIVQNDKSDQQSYWYTVLGFTFEFDFLNDLPHVDMMPHMTLIGDMEIGDILYEEVVKVTNENTKNSGIHKVYFNKENGILMFTDIDHEWKLLPDD